MEKNFRSNYYEKVGFKSVDVKKSLENILGEDAIDKTKLSQLVLKYEIPAQFRSAVWNVLLNISARNKSAREFVRDQRIEQYGVLVKCLETVGYLKKNEATEEEDDEGGLCGVMASVIALEENRLPWAECLDVSAAAAATVMTTNRRHSDEPRRDPVFRVVFNAVIGAVEGTAEQQQHADVYWLCRNLYKMVTQRKAVIRAQLKEVESYMKRNDPSLATHLDKAGLWKWRSPSPIIADMLQLAFAGVFQSEPVLRLWDKMIAGCAMCEVFVLSELLILHRSSLLTTPDCLIIEKVELIARQTSLANQHAIIDRALVIWQMDFGCVLQPNFTSPVSSSSSNSNSAASEIKLGNSSQNNNNNSKASLQRKISALVKL